jgi:predicted Zn finger-like uncharacterized protein
VPITIACDDCGKKYSVADAAAGKRVKCKACGNSFVATPVPAVATATAATATTAASPKAPPVPRPAPPPVPAATPDPPPAFHKLSQEPPVEDAPRSNSAVRLVLILAGCLVVAGGVAIAIVKPWSSSSTVEIPNTGGTAATATPGPANPAGPSPAEIAMMKQSESNLRFLAKTVTDAAKGGKLMSVSELNQTTTQYVRQSPFDTRQRAGYLYLPQNAEKGPDAILLYDRVELDHKGTTQAITVGQKMLTLTKAELQTRAGVPKQPVTAAPGSSSQPAPAERS